MNKTSVHTWHLLSIVLEALAGVIRQDKEIKKHPRGKGEVKSSLFPGDMILYIEHPKDFIKKPLEVVNKFSKFTGYKVNIQKSVVFLYNDNKLSEKEIFWKSM